MTKYIYFIFLPSLICCELSSQKENETTKTSGTRNGVITRKYPDGSLRAKIPVLNGKQHGLAVEYYKNGNKSLEITYVNGIKHGLSRRYYESGTLFKETPYDSGIINGVEKTYRENGKLSAEIPYRNGNPCMGLKEYLTDGTPRKKYPDIIVKPVDNILKEGKYTLLIYMSDNSRTVEYYRGDLLEGNCLSNFMGNIFEGKQKGVAELNFNLPPGTFIMEEINIVAKVKTRLGNYYITQKKHHLAIENR